MDASNEMKRRRQLGNPSAAYEAGRADLRAAAARHGTVRLSPSIVQREEWGHAWREYMQGWNAEKRVKNPSKFDRCVKDVKKKGGAANAYAVCTAAGTRNPSDGQAGIDAAVSGASPKEALKRHLKWVEEVERHGRKLMASERKIAQQRFYEAYRREKKRTGNPAPYGLGDERGVPIGSPFQSRAEAEREARSIASTGQRVEMLWRNRDGSYSSKWFGPKGKQNPSPKVVKTPYGGYVVQWREGGKLRESQDVFRTRQDAEAEALHIQKTRRNPADAAAEVFEQFHGYAPKEIVEVKQKVHFHRHLAAAGELVGLEVRDLNGTDRHIEGLGKALLCFNENKNQLFIRGGDQFMDEKELKKFGADGGHEIETLGQVTGVGYFTNKTHLGKEGGEAVYSHTFRTTNEFGRHITVKIARYPDLIYRVLDQQFEFSGGSYTIEAEGIDK